MRFRLTSCWFTAASFQPDYIIRNCCNFCAALDRESGEPSKRKSYLPLEKQFLITRNGEACTPVRYPSVTILRSLDFVKV